MAESTMLRAKSHYGHQMDWLRSAVRRPFSKLCDIPEDKAVHHSSARLYEREQEIYAKILRTNLDCQGIGTPVPEDIYDSPVWQSGYPLYHPLRWSCNVLFTEIDAILFADQAELTYRHYIEQLKSQFYHDHLWFRHAMKSFWGPKVECIFELSATKRPFIQIEFKHSREQVVSERGYVRCVEMFAYIMARLRPIKGLGPLASIFGFSFVDNKGRRISDFERMDRIDVKHPGDISKAALVIFDEEKMQSQHKLQIKNQKLVIYHVLQPEMSRVIEIS
ncbi:hypothetical protein F4776DRAFT_677476 [Hypoxylon sp. NC0597]|nr:hypothetical protein F4776DRAFT_677476 [Hypoxylon sp. NC0597]